MTSKTLIAALWLSAVMTSVDCANILFLSPSTCHSHTVYFQTIIKALAGRGHTITYWNGFKASGPPVDNVRQLSSQALDDFNNEKQIGFGDNIPLLLMLQFPARVSRLCKLCYSDPAILRLMNSGEQFDLLVVEAVLNECALPLVAHFKAPFIYMTSVIPSVWTFEALGNPMSFDHFPLIVYDYTDRMTLLERTVNTLTGMVAVTFRNWFMLPRVDQLARQMLNVTHLPRAQDIEKNVTLLVTNAHFSINYNYPKTPSIVEAAAIHCLPAKPLPQDLEDFVNGAGDAGFIYLSFGTLLKSNELPESTTRILVDTFARVPQRIVWKYDGRIDNLPANIRLQSWLPQQDLLGHPKIRVFISHGGLCSTQEAVYHGVPFIGLPVFADQFSNVRKATRDGYAISLDWKSLTEDILFDAIQEIINNSSYKEKIGRVSELLRDDITRPLDRAVYWIEYVIRHQGADHLKSAARLLEPYQRGLVDVALLSGLLLAAGFYLIRRLVRAVAARVKLAPHEAPELKSRDRPSKIAECQSGDVPSHPNVRHRRQS